VYIQDQLTSVLLNKVITEELMVVALTVVVEAAVQAQQEKMVARVEGAE
jgi:hypothetical protein